VTADEFKTLVERMLTEGVPPAVVARIVNMDVDLIKEAQKEVRVKRYGTDDLNDYLEQMQWRTIEEAMTSLATGSSTDKARVMSTVLGKQMTAATKRMPEGQRDAGAKIQELMASMRGDDG
jgi:hypothetical protein